VFGQQLLTFRTRAALTQIALASQIGVHRRSLLNWETGESYPKAEALQRLIAVLLALGVFTPGQERDEAAQLWEQARQDAPHPLARFDAAWFARLLAERSSTPAPARAPELPPTPSAEQRSTHALSSAQVDRPRSVVDWGEAIAVPTLYGRASELGMLQRWVVDESCRVVAILGLGGIGKSSLAITLAHQVLAQFDVVAFRSLQNGPPLAEVLDQVIRTVSDQQVSPPEQLGDKIARLVQLLRERRCLLILDNFESLMEPAAPTGTYRTGYVEYRELIRALSEREHQSCLLLTSREKPSELVPHEGRAAPVRTLPLTGLDDQACHRILEARDITATAPSVSALVRLYGGNPLALQLVSEPVHELFGGDVAAFLALGDAFFNGVGHLLTQQFDRSTPLEQAILYWLAIARELLPLSALLAHLDEAVPQRALLVALESLRHRMLIEHAANQPAFTLQPAILEYVTDHLVEAIYHELVGRQPKLVLSHAFIQATAKDHVRHSQEQLIARPLLERLVGAYGDADALEHQLLRLLEGWREHARSEQGYGPGNVVNLLRVLRGHLCGLNLSRLVLRQAYLQGVALQDSSLADSNIQDSIFTEAFDAVSALTISSSGAYWVSASRRGEVRVWTKGGLTLHRAWQAHAEQVCAIAFSPDERMVATCGGWDGTVKLWDVASGALLWSGRHTGHVNIVAFAPDGSMLASAGNDTVVELLDVQIGAPLETLLHPDPVFAVAWSPDRRLLATGDQEGCIRLWAVSKTEPPVCVETLTGHTNRVEGLAFSSDGSILASGSWDGTVKLWDTSILRPSPWPNGHPGSGHTSGQAGLLPSSTSNAGVAAKRLRQTLTGHTGRVNHVAWSPDGRTLASSSIEQAIWLWDVEQGSCRTMLHGHTAGVKGLAFTPDNHSLLSGSEDGTLRLWDVASGQCIRLVQGYGSSLYDVDWSPDGTQLVSGGSDTFVTIYTVMPETAPRVLHGHSGVVLGVGWSSNGRWLASSEWDNAIRVWHPSSGACLEVLHHSNDTVNFFDSLAWSPNGQYLASGASAHGMLVWDLTGRAHKWVGRDSSAWIRHAAWSPDSTRLAGGGDDGTVYVWDVTQDMLLQKLVGHHSMITSVAWSPNGTLLASSGGSREAGELFVWNAERGERIRSMVGHPGMVYAVAWGLRGDLLVSGSSDGTLRWWDVQTGVCVRVRQAHQGRIQSVRRSPDGTKLASCGDDGAIVLWDLHSGSYLQTLRRDRPYERMDITDLIGLTEAQRASLIALGAVERPPEHALMLASVPVSDDASLPAGGGQKLANGLPSQLSLQLLSEEPEFDDPPPILPSFLSATLPPPGPAAPFVARERELAELAAALATARSGAGQILFVIGGAGRGKTMLVQEFARQAQAADDQLLVVSGSSNAHTGNGDPYLPFREALTMLSGDVEAKWAGGLISAEHARRLWEAMPLTLPVLVDHAPDLLGTFVPSNGVRERAATFAERDVLWFNQLVAHASADASSRVAQQPILAQYSAVLSAIASQRPLLLILEDMHWVDTASSDLLVHLSREAAHSRILIVGTYRPNEVAVSRGEKVHPLAEALSELKRQHGDIWLDLGELTEAEGRRFVKAYLDTQPNRLGRAFREALFTQTGGHALFTVELVRELRDRGDLRQDADGQWIDGSAIDWTVLPARVEGAIEKRIQRLEQELRTTLTIASVEGETFTAEVVARVQQMPERELVQRLSQELGKQHRLVAAHILAWLGPQRLSLYRFRHHLFQQYVYHSLTAMERAYLHEAVGSVLEALYGEQTEPIAVQLARHFEQAGLTEKAVTYLLQASKRAARLSANQEVITHTTKGLALIERLPETRERGQTELELQIALGNALMATRGYAAAEVERAYSRAWQLCQQVYAGETAPMLRILHGRWSFNLVRGAHGTAYQLAEEFFDLAQRQHDPGIVAAHRAMGCRFFMGELVAARPHFEQIAARYSLEQHRPLTSQYGVDPGLSGLSLGALNLWLLGYVEQARQWSERVLLLAHEAAHEYTLAYTLVLLSWFHHFRRESALAQELAEEAIAICVKHGLALWLAWGTITRGWVLATQGQEAGIAQIHQSLAAAQAAEAGVFRTFQLTMLAEPYDAVGQPAAGLAALEGALALVEKNEERFWEAEIYRLKGELLLTVEDREPSYDAVKGMQDSESPEGCFLKAIEIARRQAGKSLELRATVSLARLWQQQGKTGEARHMLAAVYGWFTEGFDTIDLQQAKALLQELSG